MTQMLYNTQRCIVCCTLLEYNNSIFQQLITVVNIKIIDNALPSFTFTRNDEAITNTSYIKVYQTYALAKKLRKKNNNK